MQLTYSRVEYADYIHAAMISLSNTNDLSKYGFE